ncbi:MAG: RNA polymerase sigma factor [Candidatus Firestonebacteria bacterium]
MEERAKELIKRYQGGDEGALKELFLLYMDKIKRLCLYFSFNREEAADLGQETVLVLQSALKGFRFEAKFDTFLYRVVFNLAEKAGRKERLRKTSSLEELPEGKGSLSEDDPGEELESKEMREKVHKLILGLSPTLRETLYLRYIEEKSYEEIAGLEARPVGTIKWRLNAAKKELAEKIGIEEML